MRLTKKVYFVSQNAAEQFIAAKYDRLLLQSASDTTGSDRLILQRAPGIT